MDNLNFYLVADDYVAFLKNAEIMERGFTRIPNTEYGSSRKPKFLCGVVLRVNDIDYYVPVTSYKQQKPDNFLIRAGNGAVTSSLRFNYMFPVPRELISVRSIANEPDGAYRALLSQELRYCIKNQDEIRRLAARTYKRVNLGFDKGLVSNSCAFRFLEERSREYMQARAQARSQIPMRERMTAAQAEADRRNKGSEQQTPHKDRTREH